MATAGLLAGLLVVGAGCGPAEPDPLTRRPYLVSVDALGVEPSGTVAGTLVVERDCVVLDTPEGTVLPLFAGRTAFGPLDGGEPTVDVDGVRLRMGDEVAFTAETGLSLPTLRSRYPGVDLTRCGVGAWVLVAEVVATPAR